MNDPFEDFARTVKAIKDASKADTEKTMKALREASQHDVSVRAMVARDLKQPVEFLNKISAGNYSRLWLFL